MFVISRRSRSRSSCVLSDSPGRRARPVSSSHTRRRSARDVVRSCRRLFAIGGFWLSSVARLGRSPFGGSHRGGQSDRKGFVNYVVIFTGLRVCLGAQRFDSPARPQWV